MIEPGARRAEKPTLIMSEDYSQNTLPERPAAKTALGASLCADYEALRNDLDQAKDLAADFQRQLAGKSNELAHFKSLLQRTQEDFNRLEGHIEELRRERHRLANEAMRATALDAKVHRREEEIERLKEQIETLRTASSQRVEELLVVSEEQQREIQRLRSIVEVLRRREGGSANGSADDDRATQRQMADLQSQLKRLQAQVQQAAPGKPRREDEESLERDMINLTFER